MNSDCPSIPAPLIPKLPPWKMVVNRRATTDSIDHAGSLKEPGAVMVPIASDGRKRFASTRGTRCVRAGDKKKIRSPHPLLRAHGAAASRISANPESA